MSEPALRLENVARSYRQGQGTLEVFQDVQLDAASRRAGGAGWPFGRGQIVAAPHGGAAGGAVQPARSTSTGAAASKLPDRERTRLRRDRIGFVYQAHHLLPEFSALENVIVALAHCRPSASRGGARGRSSADASGARRAAGAPAVPTIGRRAAARRPGARLGQSSAAAACRRAYGQSRSADGASGVRRADLIWCAAKAWRRWSPPTTRSSPPRWTACSLCTRGGLSRRVGRTPRWDKSDGCGKPKRSEA